MPQQIPENHDSLKLFISIASFIVMVVNISLGIFGKLLWNSWNKFKQDVMEKLQEYQAQHTIEHTRIAEDIHTLYKKEDDDRDRIIDTSRGLEEHKKQCERHVNTCMRSKNAD